MPARASGRDRPRPLLAAALLAILLSAPAAAAVLALPDAAAPAPPETARPFLVSFTHPLSPTERADFLALGVPSLTEYHLLPLALAPLTRAQHDALLRKPYVARIDPDEAIEVHANRALPLVRAGAAHLDAFGYSGKGITIAVVDSGLDPTHPDLEGRVRASLRYLDGQWLDVGVDTQGHGTHVAGIAAGSGRESDGRLRGVAPGAGLVGLDFSGSFTASAAIAAFDWIFLHHREHGIRVVTNSWGRVDSTARYDPDAPTIRASDRLTREGLVVVFSAANKGPGASTLSAEGMNPNVITVGATDAAGVIAPWSGRGPALGTDGRPLDWVKPDVVADGTAVWSLRSPTLAPAGTGDPDLPEDPHYRALSGTSQAAPQVAGLAALLLEANPTLTPAQVLNVIRESAIDLGPPGPDPAYGWGLLDARDALHLARGEPEDHGNPLVAGGTDEHRYQGRLVAVNGRRLQLDPHPALHDDARIEIPVAVKPGTTRVAIEVVARPAQAPLRAHLERAGAMLGPWTESSVEGDSRVLRVDTPAPSDAGDWRLVVTTTHQGPLDYVVTTRTHLPAHPERASDLPARYHAYPPDHPWYQEGWDRFSLQLRSEMNAFAAALERATGLPFPLLATVALLASFAAPLLMWRARRAGRKG